jgi:pentatricopeptide repeat protein
VTLPTKERVVPTLHNIPYCWSSWALFAHGLNILGWSNEKINKYILLAIEMKKSMVEKGLVPDCYTYVTLVNGYCMEKRLKDAKSILSEMSDVGLKPDLIDGFVKQFDV